MCPPRSRVHACKSSASSDRRRASSAPLLILDNLETADDGLPIFCNMLADQASPPWLMHAPRDRPA